MHPKVLDGDLFRVQSAGQSIFRVQAREVLLHQLVSSWMLLDIRDLCHSKNNPRLLFLLLVDGIV